MDLTEYIPREELERRWSRVRRFMECDSIIVLQNVDLYYLTGTLQTAVLWFPREGEPLFAVRKSYERAKIESALKNIVPLKTYADLPGLIPNTGQTVGFELDVVPVATFQQVSKHFEKCNIVDASGTLRNARAVKTLYEIECIRRAAHQLDTVFLDIPLQLREGLAEFELAARIEYVMRMAGHQGLSRVRRFNMEMHYGAVSFGETAAYPHSFDGPVGVRGLYPAVPAMGGRKRLSRGEPVMIDIVGGYAGYIADGSRVYSLGPVSQQMRDTHEFILELNGWIEEQLKPGNIPSEIYSGILERIAKTPFAPHFMGAGENQVRFVAHSVGLELDEIPVIAPKFETPLEAGVVLAVEPKVFYPGLGGVGIENTYAITEKGREKLTVCPQDIYTV
ncbi:MAG: aminopeptidase P family protein [Acidobacteria bacterium]|nr:MAG: aminopeptidase P family protein [Acidobacteriota bacterium]